MSETLAPSMKFYEMWYNTNNKLKTLLDIIQFFVDDVHVNINVKMNFDDFDFDNYFRNLDNTWKEFCKLVNESTEIEPSPDKVKQQVKSPTPVGHQNVPKEESKAIDFSKSSKDTQEIESTKIPEKIDNTDDDDDDDEDAEEIAIKSLLNPDGLRDYLITRNNIVSLLW